MYCSKCYRQIPDDSKFCPNCGTPLQQSKNRKPFLFLAAILVFVVVLSVGLFSIKPIRKEILRKYYASAFDVTESTQATEMYTIEKITIPTEPKPEVRYFHMGETATVNGVSITWKNRYVSAGYDIWVPDSGYEFMVYEFAVENNSESDIYVNPYDFNAFFDDYATDTNSDAEWIAQQDDMQLLGGDLPPGKKMIGVIGYEVPINCKDYDVRYSPSFFGDTVIAFTFNYA